MSRFARAVIEYVTNAHQAKADAEAVKTANEEAARATQQATEKAGASAKSAGDQFADMTNKLKGVTLAAIGMGVAIATALDKLFNYREDLSKRFDDLQKSATELRDTLLQKYRFEVDANDTQKQVAAFRKQIQDTFAKINEGSGPSFVESWLGVMANRSAGINQIFQQVRDARLKEQQESYAVIRQNEEAVRVAEEQIQREADQKERERIESFKQQQTAVINALLLQRLQGIDRISAEEATALDEIEQIRKKARTDEERDALDQRKRLTMQEYDLRRAEFRKEEQEKKNAAEKASKEESDRLAEQARKQAEMIAKAYADALEKFNADVTRIMQQAFAAQQAASTGQLNSLTSNISRLTQIVDARLRATPTVLPPPSRR